MPSAKTDHAKGLLLTAVGGLVLTVDIPLLRLGNGETWSVLLVRTGATLVTALVIWSVWRALTPRAPQLIPGRAGLAVATLYGLGAITFICAVYNTSTANLVFILAFNTMFSAVLSWAFLGERPRPQTLAAMLVMALGVLVIVGDSIGRGHLLGDVFALTSAFLIASAITLSRASGRDMGFTPLVGVALPFAVAVFVVSRGGFHIAEPAWIVLNGVLVMPLSFFLLAAGPRYISAPEVAMFYLLETVLAPVWVWLVFAEAPSRNSLMGGALLITALVAHSLWQLREKRLRRSDSAANYPA